LLAGLLLVSVASAQWETCPFGLVNDTYPGSCARYIDTNNDGICDRSQTMPTTTLPGTPTSQTISTIDTTVTTVSQSDSQSTSRIRNQPVLWGEYNLIPLSAAVVLLYLASMLLSKAKRIDSVTHRKIWNVILLLSFLVCGITGIIIAVRLDLRWDIPQMALMSFWHTETGIIMIIVSVFHVLWHWKYFLAMIKGKKKEKNESDTFKVVSS